MVVTKIDSVEVYYENQRGNLCRKHSINAYFGYEQISEDQFTNYCKEYDEYMKEHYNYETDTLNNDYILSTRNNIIYYIIKKESRNIGEKYPYCLYVPINYLNKYLEMFRITLEELVYDSNDIFIFNADHVWLLKKIKGYWYSINSLNGVTSNFKLSSLLSMEKIGLIIARKGSSILIDYDRYKNRLTQYFYELNPILKMKSYLEDTDIKEIIDKLYKEDKLIGELEIFLGVIYEIYLSLVDNYSHYISLMNIKEKRKLLEYNFNLLMTSGGLGELKLSPKKSLVKYCEDYSLFINNLHKSGYNKEISKSEIPKFYNLINSYDISKIFF